MPRETVHHGDIWKYTPVKKEDLRPGELPRDADIRRYEGGPVSEGETIRQDPSFEISWSKESSHVQVSIDFSREQWLQIAEGLEKDPDVTKSAIYTGTWSRDDINRAIRTLRKARDQAFGEDA